MCKGLGFRVDPDSPAILLPQFRGDSHGKRNGNRAYVGGLAGKLPDQQFGVDAVWYGIGFRAPGFGRSY